MDSGGHFSLAISQLEPDRSVAGEMKLEFLENPRSTLLGYSRISNLRIDTGGLAPICDILYCILTKVARV